MTQRAENSIESLFFRFEESVLPREKSSELVTIDTSKQDGLASGLTFS